MDRCGLNNYRMSSYEGENMKIIKDDQEETLTSKTVLVSRDNNVIRFFDEVSDASVCEAIKHIDYIEGIKKYTGITIILNSPGGDIYNGLALYDRIRNCKKVVTIVGTGFVASMAFIIYLAGDKRICTKNARFLNHQARMEISGRVADIKIEQAEITLMEDLCVDIIAERTLLTIKKLKHDTKVGDVYISSQEAVQMGICHEIISEVIKETVNENTKNPN